MLANIFIFFLLTNSRRCVTPLDCLIEGHVSFWWYAIDQRKNRTIEEVVSALPSGTIVPSPQLRWWSGVLLALLPHALLLRGAEILYAKNIAFLAGFLACFLPREELNVPNRTIEEVVTSSMCGTLTC